MLRAQQAPRGDYGQPSAPGGPGKIIRIRVVVIYRVIAGGFGLLIERFLNHDPSQRSRRVVGVESVRSSVPSRRLGPLKMRGRFRRSRQEIGAEPISVGGASRRARRLAEWEDSALLMLSL